MSKDLSRGKISPSPSTDSSLQTSSSPQSTPCIARNPFSIVSILSRSDPKRRSPLYEDSQIQSQTSVARLYLDTQLPVLRPPAFLPVGPITGHLSRKPTPWFPWAHANSAAQDVSLGEYFSFRLLFMKEYETYSNQHVDSLSPSIYLYFQEKLDFISFLFDRYFLHFKSTKIYFLY